MAYKIIQTDSFYRDLDSAIAYIALALENRIAAASLLDAISESYDNLRAMPLMYEACQDHTLKKLGYRKAVIHNYILIYKVDEEAKTVYIMRLFHGSQNYEKLI